MGAIEEDLKAAGLPSLAWYDVLLELRRAESAGLRPKEIESRLLIAQHNVSRLIDRIEAAGYVERRTCEDDGRGQIITLTRAGQELLRRMWPVYGAAIQRNVGEALGEDAKASRLADLLGALLSGEPTPPEPSDRRRSNRPGRTR
jgi:DNA-binding MarR family transcriptional regulator